MYDAVSITFGTPTHGWLPVDFRYKDFQLKFRASDALHDSLEELYDVVTVLMDNEGKEVTWWLEPEAYFFEFKKVSGSVILKIFETEDLHNENAKKEQLIAITGDEPDIIQPFRIELMRFSSRVYEEMHWPYKLDYHKLSHPSAVDFNQAKGIAKNYVANKQQQAGIELALAEHLTLKRPYGWIFFYGAQNSDVGVAGNAPFVVTTEGAITKSRNPGSNYIADYAKYFDGVFGV